MPLKNSKPGGSAFPKHRQNTSVFPPHWVDFYQLPVENDILAGAEWIYCLWVVLHHTNPPSYLTFLGCVWHLRVYQVACSNKNTPHDILEYQGCLESICPGLINDILQEIQACNSDGVALSVDLRRRCKTAAPTLEDRVWTLQNVLIKQHEDLNLKNYFRFLDCLYQGVLTIAVLCALLAFVSTFFDIDPNSIFDYLLGLFPFFGSMLAIQTSNANSYVGKFVSQADALNTDAFKLIWAVRDMAGLLTRIAESEGSPLSDVSHAKRFLEAFRASFLGGRPVLSNFRRWLQGLPDWSDKYFTAHYWNDYDHANAEDNNVP